MKPSITVKAWEEGKVVEIGQSTWDPNVRSIRMNRTAANARACPEVSISDLTNLIVEAIRNQEVSAAQRLDICKALAGLENA